MTTKCTQCEQVFPNKSKMLIHYNRIHKRKKCGVDAITSKEELKTHIKNSEAYLEMVPKCETCGKTFNHKENYNRHVTTCKNSDEKSGKLSCSICKKVFKNVQSKCVHEKRHSGIEKYPCTECTKAFCSKADLMKHSRTHKKSECNYYKKEVIEYKMNSYIENNTN